MKHFANHEYEEHRNNPQMLKELRDYYISTGLKGNLGCIRILIEFIEAYAELKGWDLNGETGND